MPKIPITTEELEAAAERMILAIESEFEDPFIACELCSRVLSKLISKISGMKPKKALIEPNSWLTPSEAARAIGVSHRYLNELLQSGRIPSITIGRKGKHRRVKGSDLVAFLESCKGGGK